MAAQEALVVRFPLWPRVRPFAPALIATIAWYPIALGVLTLLRVTDRTVALVVTLAPILAMTLWVPSLADHLTQVRVRIWRADGEVGIGDAIGLPSLRGIELAPVGGRFFGRRREVRLIMGFGAFPIGVASMRDVRVPAELAAFLRVPLTEGLPRATSRG